jgi:hypothetical protein
MFLKQAIAREVNQGSGLTQVCDQRTLLRVLMNVAIISRW